MLHVASLHVYPVKSLGGMALNEARITDRGFAHDRRWMLVDAEGVFFTQREVHAMACLHCSPAVDGFRVTDVRDDDAIDIGWRIEEGAVRSARVWSDEVSVLHAPVEVSAWFADKLGVTCSLVFMPDHAHRAIDARYAQGITSLSDGYPFLILSQASLDDLNARMREAIPMDRFRPNIVVAGGMAFQEDYWRTIEVGAARFDLVKPCARCVIPTIDQRTGVGGKEPTRTLADYRTVKGEGGSAKVLFGMNAVATSSGSVHVGDPIRA